MNLMGLCRRLGLEEMNILGFKKKIRIISNFHYRFICDNADLLVVDSFFPNPLSLFRYVEFDTYIRNYDTLAYTTGEDLGSFDDKNNIEFFIKSYPKKDNVKRFISERKITAKLAVIVFLNNAIFFLPYLEKNKVPFIFTLYPGGGFWMKEKESDLKLKKIFNSPYFRKVIVTQNITQNYLLDNQFCSREDIEFIYGSPSNWEVQNVTYNRKKSEKKTFDICFVAAKYSVKGIDKGYDIFIEVARKLSQLSDKFKFHVVGGFMENDIDISDLSNHIKFYGYLCLEELRIFYLSQDIIISPNRTNILARGAFDGFPTGAVVEAGLCGVVMFGTDELNQNTILTDGIDFILINHDPDFIVLKVMELFCDYDRLCKISQEGSAVLRTVFSNEYQMTPRIKLIEKYLNQ
jgi:glycosyltransferase involved in cell wall biosynthesis